MEGERSERLTPMHVEASNLMLLQAASRTCGEEKLRAEDARRRKRQFQELRETLLPGVKITRAMSKIAEEWWTGEFDWATGEGLVSDRSTYERHVYRLLVMNLRNANMCPFSKPKKRLMREDGVKADSDDFESRYEEQVTRFLAASGSHLRRRNEPCFKDLAEPLSALEEVDFGRELYSARHELLAKDWQMLKGLVIGGVLGVGTSLVMGPVVGTWIGNAVGLHGAAATSFGLAFLGGGSLASGGFGMLGGSVVLGVAFGGGRAARAGLSASEIELLELGIAARNLPILLATGRMSSYVGCERVPTWIRERIGERYDEVLERLEGLKRNDAETKKRRKALQANCDLLLRAFEMAEDYQWTSSYDLWRRMVGR